jgi:threonylcarbamoyladenosine tRNA methylthiotransferase MtaB
VAGEATPGGAPRGAVLSFRTLGCRLNQCETARMEEAVTERGYQLAPWDTPVDVRVLNTCTVTAKTDRECRREIRRALRLDPGSRMVVTGCYAQIAPEQAAAIPGVSLVLGNADKDDLPVHVARLLAAPSSAGEAGWAPICVTPLEEAPAFHGGLIHRFSGYTRAFLEVQTGCDNRCSYCVIPDARGPSRSMALADVLEQVAVLAEAGFREIVLTGIHLGGWGKDTAEGSLSDLLANLVSVGAADDLRFRLSSTEPIEVSDRVLEVMTANRDRFAQHFHVPLQSGSDAVLRRMNRAYRAEAYLERVDAIRSAFPDAALGADVIVGFPGETDDEFEETLTLISRSPLTYLHVFSYSDRPGTRATGMPDKVRPEVAAARSDQLRRLGKQKDAEFQARFAGETLEALILKEREEGGNLVGLTGNYLEVLLTGPDDLKNDYALVRLLSRRDDGRWQGVLSR